jgi:hypothetical protein
MKMNTYVNFAGNAQKLFSITRNTLVQRAA